MFDREAVMECLKMGPNYQTRGFESSLYDRENIQTIYKNRFEVLEYWGIIDRKTADECGLSYEGDSDVIYMLMFGYVVIKF